MKQILLFLLVFINVTIAQTYNDPLFPEQDNLTSIRVPDVWSAFSTFGDTNVVIAVFGLGVDITHPDLNDNIFGCCPGSISAENKEILLNYFYLNKN